MARLAPYQSMTLRTSAMTSGPIPSPGRMRSEGLDMGGLSCFDAWGVACGCRGVNITRARDHRPVDVRDGADVRDRAPAGCETDEAVARIGSRSHGHFVQSGFRARTDPRDTHRRLTLHRMVRCNDAPPTGALRKGSQ